MTSSKRALFLFIAVALIALGVVLFSAEDKRISVYAPQSNFTLHVTDSEDREYVDLFAVLQPISRAAMKVDGNTVRITGNAEAVLNQGENNIRVGAKRVRFPGKVLIADGRALVPLVAVPALVQEIAGLKAELHEAGRRLFIENTQTRFSVELQKGGESQLALAFPMRVTPNISQDGSTVKLVFRQEPVVMSAESVSFNDPSITSLHFKEDNGLAEVTVKGSAPLLVSFADDGKTLMVKLAPPPAKPAVASAPPVAMPSGASPAAVTTPPGTAPATPTAASPFPFDNVRYVVMIDPGHGGTDPGVRFSDKVYEKDIALAIAKRLRGELQNRGVAAVLSRESDTALTFEQRAAATNGQRAALYVTVHAGGLGNGVRVFAPVMPKNEPVQGPFIPWDRAQESFRERSNLLARAVANEIKGKKIAAQMLNAAVPPLRAVYAPAISIEVAPPTVGAAPEEFDKVAYQQAIVVATANAIVNTRTKLEQMR